MSGKIHKLTGAREEQKGVTIVGPRKIKGVKILDSSTKGTPPPVEITENEGDKG